MVSCLRLSRSACLGPPQVLRASAEPLSRNSGRQPLVPTADSRIQIASPLLGFQQRLSLSEKARGQVGIFKEIRPRKNSKNY